MVKIGEPRRSYLVLLLCIAASCWAGALTASAAFAGSVEGVTQPVREAVGETVTRPLQEATEAATAPAQGATEAAPPVQEVTEAATAPVEGVAKEVTPPVKAAAEAVSHPSASSPKPSLPLNQTVGTVGKAASSLGSTVKSEGVNRTAKEADENVTGPAQPASNNAGLSGSDAAGGSPEEAAAPDSASPPSNDRTAAPQGASFVPPPSRNGATAAPLPRWISYVWPAIALARPDLVRLWERSEAAVRLLIGTSGGSGTGPVVAAVHSSGGEGGSAADSSSPTSPASSFPSSPLSKITSAVGGFPYNAAGAALGYILIVAIMIIALFAAIRWEIVHGRREGRE